MAARPHARLSDSARAPARSGSRFGNAAPAVDNGVMAKLTDDEVAAALDGLPEWTRAGDEIVRTVELDTFPGAIAFVGRVAELAEAADHHPDLDIRYRTVRVALTTHDSGGLTVRDIDLAGQIDAVVAG
jgi:4a-hydroxytetrahydrobiopterin dehydratase